MLPYPDLFSYCYSGRVAAGSPVLAQQHVEHTYQFDRSLFQQQPD
jgi:repressor LexA